MSMKSQGNKTGNSFYSLSREEATNTDGIDTD